MGGAIHDLDMGSLPATVPVLPLPGVVLLPRGRLPLNIFEPRYLNLTEDALAQGRMLGMVQPRQTHPDPVPDDADMHETGSLGRIVAFNETEDGRFLVTLVGICRFRVTGEAEGCRGYRRVHADFSAFGDDLREDDSSLLDRGRLMEAVRTYFGVKGIEADWEAVGEAPDEALVISLATICPFELGEKQALLECADTGARGELLTTLMEFAAHPSADAAGFTH